MKLVMRQSLAGIAILALSLSIYSVAAFVVNYQPPPDCSNLRVEYGSSESGYFWAWYDRYWWAESRDDGNASFASDVKEGMDARVLVWHGGWEGLNGLGFYERGFLPDVPLHELWYEWNYAKEHFPISEHQIEDARMIILCLEERI